MQTETTGKTPRKASKMYGNKPPAARRLAQFPQQLADGGMVARMKSADAGPATFGSRGLSQLRDMIPKMQAMGYPQQAAAAPAAADPRAAQLQAMIPQVEAMGYKQQPQRLADGGFVSAAKRMMGLTPEDPARAARLAEYKANAEREKAAAKAASAPATAPAPQAAISQYSGMSAMQRREKEQGLANGGMIRGPGTGTSDSISTEAEPGTFIMPADSTKAIGPRVLERLGTVPVRLSDGEFKLEPEQVMALGAAVLKLLKDTTHTPVNGEDGGQTDAEVGEGAGHEQSEAGGEGMEDEGEGEAGGFNPAQRLAQMPKQLFADGGMVENDVTRVGNSYSGGNVGGNITVNGAPTAGTFNENPASRMGAMPTPPAAPAPMASAAPSPAPQTAAAPAAAPAATMGWAERNAQRSNQVTASSILDSPERRAAQTALMPAPVAAPAPVAPPTAAQRFGTLPALGQPAPVEQPRRYADGATVKDDRAKLLEQIPTTPNQPAPPATPLPAAASNPAQGMPYGEQMRNVGAALVNAPVTAFKHLVSAPGYGLNRPSAAPAVQSAAGGGRGSINPAPVTPSLPAPTMAATTTADAPPPEASAAAAGPAPLISGAATQQNDAAAGAVSRRGAADALAQMPNAPAPVTAPTVRNSTNDWAARKALENAATAASSITANGSAWDKTGRGDSPAQAAYKAALATDQALQQAQPGMDQAAMRENAGIQREGMQQQGANTRSLGQIALEQQKINQAGESQGFANRAAGRLEALQTAYQTAKTPEERSTLAQQIRGIQGRNDPAEWGVQVTPTTKNIDGSTSMGSIVRYNKATGQTEVVQQPGQGGGAQPSANHLAALKANPKQAAQFDEVYGPGAAARALKGG